MKRIQLYHLAHSRAGDKGNRCNLSVIPYRPEWYPVLLEQVTTGAVFEVFQHKINSHQGVESVTRYELPKLPALNFVIDDVLEGGVNEGLGLDGHGKTLSFLLLQSMWIDVDVYDKHKG